MTPKEYFHTTRQDAPGDESGKSSAVCACEKSPPGKIRRSSRAACLSYFFSFTCSG